MTPKRFKILVKMKAASLTHKAMTTKPNSKLYHKDGWNEYPKTFDGEDKLEHAHNPSLNHQLENNLLGQWQLAHEKDLQVEFSYKHSKG